MPDLTNLNAILTWLAAGGGAIVITWIGSVLLDRIPAYNALDGLAKRGIAILGGGLIGLGAWAVVTYVPAETLTAIAPAFTAFMLSALGAGAGQLAKAVSKLLTKPSA